METNKLDSKYKFNNIKGFGFMYDECIACLEVSEKAVKFTWRPWKNIPIDLPIIFWTDDKKVVQAFIAFCGIMISEEDKLKLMSEECFSVMLERNNSGLWIG